MLLPRQLILLSLPRRHEHLPSKLTTIPTPTHHPDGLQIRLCSGQISVQELYIDCDEPQCMAFVPPTDRLQFAQRGPGVSTLKAIRGVQKVEFSNHSPILESILKASMEGPASKRSKELAVEMKEWSRPKRAAASKNIRKA